MKTGDRYIVDDRCGCVAVRDTTLINQDLPGLHGDEDDCVEFWIKKKVDTRCECCGHVRNVWDANSHVADAQELADRLNAEERATK